VSTAAGDNRCDASDPLGGQGADQLGALALQIPRYHPHGADSTGRNPIRRGPSIFAVIVGDPWHARGLGAALLARLIERARDAGHLAVHATVLAENTACIAVPRRAGFASRSGAGADARVPARGHRTARPEESMSGGVTDIDLVTRAVQLLRFAHRAAADRFPDER
jgi:GNAT superfamily N-acetyltransferase